MTTCSVNICGRMQIQWINVRGDIFSFLAKQSLVNFIWQRTKEAEIVGSIGQYTSVWKVLVSEHQGADIKDRIRLSISSADSKFPFWNAVFLTEQLTDEGY